MQEWLWMNRGTLLSIYVLILVLVAFWRGGSPEKAIAVVFAAMLGFARSYHFIISDGKSVWSGSTYQNVDIGHLAIDSLALIAFVIIAVRANRIYPLCIGGFQIVATFSHFSRSLLPEAHPVAYAFIERAPFYVQTAAFTIGLVAYLARTRRGEVNRDWRKSDPV